MIKTRLKFLVYDPDRHGNPRWYVRKPGQKKVRIREPIEDANGITEKFMAAYFKALEQMPPTAPKVLRAETFNWLVDQFYRSPAFRDLDPSTQQVRRGILDRFCETAGELPFRRYRRADLMRGREKRQATPAAADNFVKAMRRLFNWAIEQEHVTVNPVAGIKPLLKSDGWHTWTEAEIEQFRRHYPVGTRQRLALEVMLTVGARRSDAVRLGPKHEDKGWLKFTAWKNRKRAPKTIDVPIRPELAAALACTQTGDTTYIVTDRGRPYTVESFGNVFRDWCNEAGLPHCSAHGLRKAAAVELAETGSSASELCAIFGWGKLETAEIYVRKAQRKRLAGNAYARLDEHRAKKSVPLPASETPSETKREKSHAKSKRKRSDGVPEGIRTPDLRFRKPLLYPAELPGRTKLRVA